MHARLLFSFFFFNCLDQLACNLINQMNPKINDHINLRNHHISNYMTRMLLSPSVGNKFVDIYSRKKLLKLPYVLIGLGFSTGDYV